MAGVSFDDVDDLVSCGNGTSIDSLTTFTFSAWINITNLPSNAEYDAIIAQRNDVTQRLFFYLNGDTSESYGSGRINFDITTDATSAKSHSTNVPSTGTWIHALGTYNNAGDRTAYLFVNGVDTTTVRAAATGTMISTPTIDISLGNRIVSQTRAFDGIINEVAIWSVVLTQAEITQLALSKDKRTPLQIRPDSLAAYWPLDEQPDGNSGDADSFFDMTANANTCTGNNGADNLGLTAKAEAVLSYP